MDSGAWKATVHGVAKELDTSEWLNNSIKYDVCIYKYTHIGAYAKRDRGRYYQRCLWVEELKMKITIQILLY